MGEERQNVFQIFGETLRQMRESVNRSWVGRSIDWVGHNFGAFIRQGSKEIAQVLPAFPESVRPVEELGTMGNPTQLEVNQEKGLSGGREGFERDKGYEEWLDTRAELARKPPDNDMGREL
jgi:hypothetical protein